MDLQHRVVTCWTDLDHYAADWDRLWVQSEIGQEQVYSYRWMRQASWLVPDGHPWCVVGSKDGVPVAIAPLFFRRQALTRFALRFGVISPMPNSMTLRHGMLAEGRGLEAVPALLEAFANDPAADCIVLKGLSEDVAIASARAVERSGGLCTLIRLNEHHGGEPGTVFSDLCAIEVPESWNEYLATRRKQFRSNVRRAYRLAASAGQLGFWRNVRGEQVAGEAMSPDEIVGHIERVEKGSWQKEARRHLGVNGYRRVRELLDILVADRLADVAFLLLDGVPIAYYFGSVVGRFASCYFIGYDREHRAISPGILLLSEIVRTSAAANIGLVNLTGSQQLFKQQLADRKDSAYELTIYGRSLKARLLYAARRMRGSHHSTVGRLRVPPA